MRGDGTNAEGARYRMGAGMQDLCTAAWDPFVHPVLGWRMTFDARIDPGALGRAVRSVLESEPVLACGELEERVFSGVWERCETVDPFTLLQTEDPDTDADAFYGRPLPRNGPRIHVSLLRSRQGDDVCMKVDHRAADAWSVKELACRLAEAYTDESSRPPRHVEPDLGPRPEVMDVWRALTREQRESARRQPGWRVTKWKTPFPQDACGDPRSLRLTLSPERFAAIRAYAKEQGATMNDILMAAMVRSATRVFPAPPDAGVIVVVTVDYRRLVSEAVSGRIGNVSGGCAVHVPVAGPCAFSDTLRLVVAATSRWKECLWGVGSARRSLAPFRVLRGMNKMMLQSAVAKDLSQLFDVNVGVIDDERLVFSGLVPSGAHALGMIPKAPSFHFTLSTYRENLTVWTWARGGEMLSLLDQTLAGTDEELGAAVATV